MKRGTAALAGAVALLALPVGAVGDSSATTKALRGGEFDVRFVLKAVDGEPVALKRFRYRRLEVFCDGGVVAKVRGRFPYIKVNDRRRFSDSLRRPSKTVRVRGRVSRDLDTVRGRIRARGDFAPEARNCDSGRVRWRAG